MTLNIKCPNCGCDINLDPYKNAIRQWLNTEASSKRMTKISPKKRSEIARYAVLKRWEKHRMGGQKSKPPEAK